LSFLSAALFNGSIEGEQIMRLSYSFFLAVVALLMGIITSPAFAISTVDVSGEIRVRPEMKANSDFSDANDDEARFIGNRVRLNVKATISETVRAKVTVQDTRRWGEANQVSTGTEVQALDIYQAYFEVDKIADAPVGVKVGRQTLVYGDQRLLGHLGWTDNARTHDAAKGIITLGPAKIDLFVAKEAESGLPTDESHDDDLMGVYIVIKPADWGSLDMYGINWKTAASIDVDGVATPTAGKNIMTYGARAQINVADLTVTGEFVMQSGDWANGVTQEATAYAAKASYKLGPVTILAEYAAGSGDDDLTDGVHKTFVFPFHTNHAHYGAMDFFSWGNMTDIHVGLAAGPFAGVTVAADYHMLALMEASDNWLNVVGTGTFRAPVSGSTATDAGAEIDVTIKWNAMENLKVQAGYSLFTPGDAAKERSNGNSDNATWGYFMTTFTF
jgi:hypothetical protein